MVLDPDSCAVRFNYRCRGAAYQAYMRDKGASLESIYAEAKARPFGKRVLFIGNSHIREVAEAFLCQRRSRIESWARLDASGCMKASAYGENCDGNDPSCRDEFSRTTFQDGGAAYVAVNHPWIYKGMQGLKKAFGLLQLDVAELDVVVVGAWNTDSWARKKFIFKHAMPICGSADPFELLDLRPFTAAEFAAALRDLGFRGSMLLGGMFGKPAPGDVDLRERLRQGDYGFAVRSLAPFPYTCASADCSARPGHQCLPGPPDFVAAEIAGES